MRIHLTFYNVILDEQWAPSNAELTALVEVRATSCNHLPLREYPLLRGRKAEDPLLVTTEGEEELLQVVLSLEGVVDAEIVEDNLLLISRTPEYTWDQLRAQVEGVIDELVQDDTEGGEVYDITDTSLNRTGDPYASLRYRALSV